MGLLFGFLLFLALLLFIGLWRNSWKSEFFLGGRQASGSIIAGSLLATCFGGSATLGVVSKAYDIGWTAFWWLGSGSIGLLFLGFFWAKAMRAVGNVRTLPEWMGYHYGKPARIFAGCLIVIMWIGVIASQFVAMGTVLQVLGGTADLWPIVAGGTVVTAYVVVGGQWSVLRTDILQCFVLTLGLAIPALLLSDLPITKTLTSAGMKQVFLPEELHAVHWLSLIVVIGGMYIVGPDLCSRVLAARDVKSAQKGAFIAAGGLFLGALVFTTLGAALNHTGTELDSARLALPWLIKHNLPEIIGVVANLGLIAALLSSADTCLLTAASVLELDVVGVRDSADSEQHSGSARIFVVALSACSLMLACVNPRIIGNIMIAYALYAGGLMVPLLFTVFNEGKRQIKRTTVWRAMAVGAAVPFVTLISEVIQIRDPLLTLACAGFAGVCSSVAVMAGGIIDQYIGSNSS